MKKTLLASLVILLSISNIYTQNRSNSDDHNLNPTLYGQQRSIGVSLLGDGIVGMVFRFAQPNQNQFEISPSLQALVETFVNSVGDTEFESADVGINVGGAYNIYLGTKEKTFKNKVIKNYIGIRANVGFVGDAIIGGHLVWHREAFYIGDYNYSRGLDLGLGFTEVLDNPFDTFNTGFNLFLKFDWNWFRSR